jgi:lysozyme
MTDLRISKAAIDLVKKFEGLRLHAYVCPAGVVTIGYGYTNNAGFGPGVKMGDVWTQQQAENMLVEGLRNFAARIQDHFVIKPNPDQFGAFVSLAYNIGRESFIKSTALERWNAGDVKGSAEALTWWKKAGGKVLRGLVRRREEEAALILAEPPVGAVQIDPPRETRAKSKTLQASATQVVAGTGTAVAAIGGLDGAAQLVAIGGAVLVVLAALWIMRERLKKWANGDR